MSTQSVVRSRLVLGICLATGFTTLLDQAILNVAVPALRADLGADRGEIQWILGSTLGTSLVITLFLQEGLGLSPLAAGLCTLPSAIAMGLASAFAWRVVGRWGRPSVTWALVLLAVVTLGTIAAVDHLPAAVLPLVLAGSQLLAGAAGGALGGYRTGLATGLWIAAVLTIVGAVGSAFDRSRQGSAAATAGPS